MRRGRSCARCGRTAREAIDGLSRHHIFPRRWNRQRSTAFPQVLRRITITLCRKPCHDRLDKILVKWERSKGRLSEGEYKRILRIYIYGPKMGLRRSDLPLEYRNRPYMVKRVIHDVYNVYSKTG